MDTSMLSPHPIQDIIDAPSIFKEKLNEEEQKLYTRISPD